MSQGKFKLFQREVTSCCDGSLEAINRTNCSFIWSRNVYIWLIRSGNFKNYGSGNQVSLSWCMLRTEKLIAFNMTYVCGHFIQIHGCLYTNNYQQLHKWFIYLVFFTEIQCYNGLMKACALNNHIKSWSLLHELSILNIATCNFYFSDYLCTLLLQTTVVECDYVLTRTSSNTLIAAQFSK